MVLYNFFSIFNFAINKPNILNKKFKKKPGNMVIFDD